MKEETMNLKENIERYYVWVWKKKREGGNII